MEDTKEVNPKEKFYRKGWFWVILVIIFFIILFRGCREQPQKEQQLTPKQEELKNEEPQKQEEPQNEQPQEQKEIKPQELNELGAEGYLRLPDTNDPNQVILLTTDKNDYEKVVKALLIEDYLGALEIPTVFGVSNGTKIKLIDKTMFLRRVRIIQGVRGVDNDKVGMSGWVAKEWVVDK